MSLSSFVSKCHEPFKIGCRLMDQLESALELGSSYNGSCMSSDRFLPSTEGLLKAQWGRHQFTFQSMPTTMMTTSAAAYDQI